MNAHHPLIRRLMFIIGMTFGMATLVHATESSTLADALALRYKPCPIDKASPRYEEQQKDTQGITPLEPVNLSNCPTYGVLLKGPVAALTPEYIFKQYTRRLWRTSTLTPPDRLDKGREAIDHWLSPNTVLALNKATLEGETITMLWMSVDPITPSEHPERQPVEMGLALRFRIPSNWDYNGARKQEVLDWISQWVATFGSLDEAKKFSQVTFAGTTKPNPIANDIHIIDLSKSAPSTSSQNRPNPIANDIHVLDLSKTSGKSKSSLQPNVLQEGMSIESVKALLGAPKDISIFGDTTTFAYPDKILVFKQGKLTEVKYR